MAAAMASATAVASATASAKVTAAATTKVTATTTATERRGWRSEASTRLSREAPDPRPG